MFGDYYYKEMELKEALDKAIIINTDPAREPKSWRDIDRIIQEGINVKMPLDGPLWQFEIFNCTIDGKEVAACIWKCHHSFCDGVSITCFTLALSKEYDRSYFIKSSDVSLLEQLALKLMVPFYLPLVFINQLFQAADRNFLTVKKGQLSGQMNAVASSTLNFPAVKLLSK